LNVKGFLSGLLSRRDWIYLLSLLVPLVVYDLALKAYDVASQPGGAGLTQTLGLMRSDIFFNLGYALFWVGLFAVARRGLLRWVVVVLLHAVTILVVTVTTCAHQYFKDNGTTLDYGTIAEWIPKFDEIKPILTNDVPLSAWMLLAAALFYATLGPWLLTRAAGRWWGWPGVSPAETKEFPFLSSLGLWLLALGFGSLSLLAGPGIAGAGESFARDSFINVVLTGVEGATASEGDYLDAGAPVESPAAHVSLAETDQTEKRNVVLIHLESTRAQSVTPYNEDLKTTPFLDELAKSSLLAEQAYTIVPRTSKANVTVNCGIEPPLYPGPEFEPGGIPVPCLAGLLKDQGYNTVFFMSTSETMDSFGKVVRNFGYDKFYSSETMNKGDFQVTNTFGYEDDIMLKPSEQWLKVHGNQPFMAEYLTGTGHYGYECLGTRYGDEDFSEDDQLNRYLNCLHLQDIFVKNLIDQYKELGLYENTIFVIYGDHGEGFGEHGRFMHGDTIWEEGLRVPLIIHDPNRFQNGERIKGLTNQIDIVPTVLELLGYEVKGGQYPGYSLLHPLPGDRTLRFDCISNRKCLASIKGTQKYIYHYDDLPDEFFDLSKDPLEEHNLADEHSQTEMEKRREDLLKWRSRVVAEYGGAVNLR
jgi:phosphoglycerol transferase MdoB-like AlkP superfamily enzyme